MGTDYYVVFPKAAYGDQNVEAVVSSPSPQRIIATKPGGRKDTFSITSPHTVQVIDTIFHIEGKSEIIDQQGATRIQAASPISVLGQFGTTGISGTMNCLPVSAWGTEYYVLDEPEGANSGYNDYPAVFSVPQVTIIASQNDTKIDITLPSQSRTALDRTGRFTITLNAGDVYYFTDGADPNAVNRVENTCLSPSGDFTGTHIVSQDPMKPIGVIVSQSHTSEPCGDNQCGDFGMEWLPPISAWDTAYVITTSVPHGGTDPGQGELLRVTFAYNNTTLYKEDVSGRVSQGTYDAGYPLFIGNPIQEPYVLAADQPFLVTEITTKPQSCTVNQGSGNFTFSMVFLPGVDEWTDFVPFSSADLAQFSQANIYFRQADEHNLYFNGQPLLLASPVINIIPGTPYAYMAVPLGSNTYYEMRGDSGASAGGAIYGYGMGSFAANNGSGGAHTLQPVMTKSFAHPIGFDNVSPISPDSFPPTMIVSQTSGCAKWLITVYDTTGGYLSTGLSTIYLAENAPPDSSYNVAFLTTPSFQYGAQSATFEVDVVNLADSAAATLHIRDRAGNELDTTLYFSGLIVAASPKNLDVGSVREGDTASGTIILTNKSSIAAIFTELKFQNGKYWKIVNIPPIQFPLTLQPGQSDTVHIRYNSPISPLYECNADTLVATTCREFPIATVNGCTLKPAIYANDYDFGCWKIDTLGLGGDTIFSPQSKAGIYIASIGTDTLHITGASLIPMPGNVPNPNADFAIMGYYDKMKGTSVSLPDALPPGDTMFVIVRGHPTIMSSSIQAEIIYMNDANHYLRDTSILSICGLAPGIVAHSVDYGTHLYATTKDSFIVVLNSGQTPDTVDELIAHGPDSAYFIPYPFGQGYIDPTTGKYIVYPNLNYVLPSNGSPWDSVFYPYRFYARKLGANIDSMEVVNSSGTTPLLLLTANIVQPHIWGRSGCLPDTLTAGDTATASVRIGNIGTDSLVVDTITINGSSASDWTISSIYDPTTGQMVTAPPWHVTLVGRTSASPYGDIAYVNLLYRATHNGAPTEAISFSGYDALGRHANDSLISAYNWGSFPYDTTITIVDCSVASGVNEQDNAIPSTVILSQNYPNPFNTATTFTFTAVENSDYRVDIYNDMGVRIASLRASEVLPGKYSAAWNANGWSSGVYYYRVSTGENSNTSGAAKSFLLLR